MTSAEKQMDGAVGNVYSLCHTLASYSAAALLGIPGQTEGGVAQVNRSH